MSPSAADAANQEMVDRLIAEGALWSQPLIAAFRDTPRHHFLHRVYQWQRRANRWHAVSTSDPDAAKLRLVYSDRALITRLSRATPEAPVSSSSQPSLMAQMLEDLKLQPGQRVLEVGTGTGYNAALLAHRVGPGRVLSLDVDREVLAEAAAHLEAFPARGVTLWHADGRRGCAEAAPFDRILVTAATPDLEPAWLEQLAPGGLLLAPWTLAPGLAFLVRGTAADGIFHGRLTRAAYFMPLRAEEEGGGEAEGLPATGPLYRLPAPWAGWFERRRPRRPWPAFTQALAFLGLLRGLAVAYQRVGDGPPAFVVSDPGAGDLCVLGAEMWQVSGAGGRDLGVRLWRHFLDAGGPWPTEFRLRAAPHGMALPPERGDYVRDGPRCRQCWQMVGERDRPPGS